MWNLSEMVNRSSRKGGKRGVMKEAEETTKKKVEHHEIKCARRARDASRIACGLISFLQVAQVCSILDPVSFVLMLYSTSAGMIYPGEVGLTHEAARKHDFNNIRTQHATHRARGARI